MRCRVSRCVSVESMLWTHAEFAGILALLGARPAAVVLQTLTDRCPLFRHIGMLNSVFSFPSAQYYSVDHSVSCSLRHTFKNEKS